MAEMLDIAQSAYAYLESGKTSMSIDRLIRITEILELDIHQVMDKIIQFRSVMHHKQPDQKPMQTFLYPDTKEAYDLLILELHNEIGFLRNLIKKN
jgi:transcriptional regulator with XRE-family HTH domain